jgi:hypothetical protein
MDDRVFAGQRCDLNLARRDGTRRYYSKETRMGEEEER